MIFTGEKTSFEKEKENNEKSYLDKGEAIITDENFSFKSEETNIENKKPLGNKQAKKLHKILSNDNESRDVNLKGVHYFLSFFNTLHGNKVSNLCYNNCIISLRRKYNLFDLKLKGFITPALITWDDYFSDTNNKLKSSKFYKNNSQHSTVDKKDNKRKLVYLQDVHQLLMEKCQENSSVGILESNITQEEAIISLFNVFYQIYAVKRRFFDGLQFVPKKDQLTDPKSE
eukprot:snap_masked-scaffold_71-processed-gene-0.38-mRNA-1 protein AED:1.00 eAED:1.00 QI:0/0/0/0/1/1/2/0/228